VWECRDSAHEAEKVADQIHFLNQSRGAPWSDFCILFRGNHQSRPLEKALQMLRVPYHITGGTAFLDRGEVKDAMAWLRCIANPDDDAAFLRAVQSPKREVGATTLAKLAELAQHAHLPLSRAGRIGRLAEATASRARQLHCRASPICCGFAQTLARLPPAELVRKLNERSGLLAMVRAQCKDEATFQRRRRTSTNSPTGSTARRPRPRRTRRRARAAVARRQGRRRQPGAPDVAACGEGPGVPLRLHRRRRGRQPAARCVDRGRPHG
jgi:ATP-dependent DNA helicase Rep